MPAVILDKKQRKEEGFSIIELIIVMLVVAILSVLAVVSFKAEKKYSADTQAYQINDLLTEARQRALTQHETMRVEFNLTRKLIRLITENDPGNANDDKEIRNIKIPDAGTVVVGTVPKNVSSPPIEMSPTPVLAYKQSVYPLSQSDSVITLRFARTGEVRDAGSNAIGDNSTTTGATIYVWMPDYTTGGQPLATGSIIRAITVQSTSGLSRYWKCQLVNGSCTNWVQ